MIFWWLEALSTHVVLQVSRISNPNPQSFDRNSDREANERKIQSWKLKVCWLVVENDAGGGKPGEARVEVDEEENLVDKLQFVVRLLLPHFQFLFGLSSFGKPLPWRGV
jgi:hypothetical protein